jgi:D-glycero-D-manno-heptose 1,7-bisphosphate phosphatase
LVTLKLVVLDRDGVINQDSDAFIRSSVQWRAIDGSPEAIGLLSNNGFTVAVATNQSGLARGLFDEDALNEIHRVMAVTIAEAGGKIDRIVYCPHGPDDNCDCRKPAPGLLHQLGAYYALSMHGVPFIGDSLRDLEAAAAIGARGILVRSGKGAATEDALRAAGKSAETYDNLLQAAQYLIAEHR